MIDKGVVNKLSLGWSRFFKTKWIESERIEIDMNWNFEIYLKLNERIKRLYKKQSGVSTEKTTKGSGKETNPVIIIYITTQAAHVQSVKQKVWAMATL